MQNEADIHGNNKRREDDLDYEAGRRDGRIESLERAHLSHEERLDKHEIRLQTQERITYALLGAVALIEFLPFAQQAFTK